MKFDLIAAIFAALFLFVVFGESAQAGNTLTVTCPVHLNLSVQSNSPNANNAPVPYPLPTSSNERQASVGAGNTITCSYQIVYRSTLPPAADPATAMPSAVCPPITVAPTFGLPSGNGGWSGPPFTVTATLAKEFVSLQKNSPPHFQYVCNYSAGTSAASSPGSLTPSYVVVTATLSPTASPPANDSCMVKASDPHQVVCTIPTPTCTPSMSESVAAADGNPSSTFQQNVQYFTGTLMNGSTQIFPKQGTFPNTYYGFFEQALTDYAAADSWQQVPPAGMSPGVGAWNATQTAVNCSYIMMPTKSYSAWSGSFQITCSGNGCSF